MGFVEITEIVAVKVAGPFAMETVAGFTVIAETVKVGFEEPPLTLKLPMYPPFVLENPEVSVNAEIITVQPPVKVVAGIVTVT